MAYLLKRTKKSFIKFYRKISSKQFAQKLEEEEISTNNVHESPSFDETPAIESKTFKVEGATNKQATESLASQPNYPQSYENYAVQNFESSKRSSFDDSHSDKILHSLTSKLFLTANGYEFHRLQQLRSDTASAVLQFEPDSTSEVVFEKVNFNRQLRYYRRTPSNCSLDNFSMHSTSMVADCLQQPDAMKPDHNRNYENTNPGLQTMNISHQNVPSKASAESKTDGNDHDGNIMGDRDNRNKMMPMVKWDINGNTLECDNVFINDNWDAFDSKVNFLYDKRHIQLKSDDSQKSSFQSSCTTLETWVEDEIIENSFNEKLELQCNICLIQS